MIEKLIRMGVAEFIQKVLAGEKYFVGIGLDDINLSSYERYNEMQKYLKSCNHREEPIDLSNSSLRVIIAKNLYLPFVKAIETDFSEANLQGANLCGVIGLEKAINFSDELFKNRTQISQSPRPKRYL
ncbi:hypothetical protein J4232_01410 [Candidatus Woesearchaeota archaeon]|nr:hypothetical protein [Candidatus Woesearchaeota archaeon]